MIGKVRRVDYSPDEYIGGVGGVLRADEQGVYWMVCTLIMSEGGPIPNDDRRIAGLTRIRPAEARKIIEKLVRMDKLKLTGEGFLSQKRAQSEVERSANRIQIATENGAKGGRPKQKDKQDQREPEADGYSPAKLTNNYQPSTADVPSEQSVISPKRTRTKHAYSPKFSEFWAAFPTDALMSKPEAATVFEALPDDEQDDAIRSLTAFRAYCSAHPDYRPVHAVRYLKQARFEGFNKTAALVDSREWVKLGSETWDAIRRRRGVASLAHKENRGERGWWFSKDEIAAARNLIAEQSSLGAVH